MKILSFAIFIFLFIFFKKNSAIEFEFYAAPLTTECFGEAVSENTLMIGEISTSEALIAVKLYDPNGKLLFSKLNETIIKFSATSQVSGTFQVCIESLAKHFLNYVVELETGVFAKDYSEMAQTKNLKPIEITLKKTEDIMKEIHNTASFFIGKKEESLETLESINFKIILFSTFTIIIMVLLGFLQANYLKQFFKAKKLL